MELGVRESRTDRHRLDTGSGQLDGEALGEHRGPRFRCRVGAAGDPTRDAAHGEDVTSAPIDHPGQRRVCETHNRCDEDIEHLLFLMDARIEESALHPEAGVVHQHIDLESTDGAGHAIDVRALGQVGGDNLCLHPVDLVHLLRQGIQSHPIPTHQDKVVTLSSERLRETLTDSGRGTSDQCTGHPPILVHRRTYRGVVLLRTLGSSLACVMAGAALTLTPVNATEGTVEPRVIGGQEADPGEFGFVASVLDAPRYRQSGAYQAQYCAASLTSPTTVITAAHCLVDQETGRELKPRDVLIGFGSNLRSPTLRVIAVEDFRVHPEYRIKTAANDIAVVYLAQPVPDLPVIALAQGVEVDAYDAPGTAAKVAGWGNTSARGNRFLPELQVGNLRVFPDGSCGRGARYEVNGVSFKGFAKRDANARTMLCAAGASPAGAIIDACQGDSGGPLTAGAGDARRLIGVVSWGQQCASRFPGVYTRISSETEFLIDSGVLPDRPPILAPEVEVTTTSETSARIQFLAAKDGTRIESFAATMTDSATGEVYSCTTAPAAGRRTASCTVVGLPSSGSFRVEAISGNSAGSSPVSSPVVVDR